jgi:glycosyltransferase involved in cell wall biosynthesis
MKIAIDTGPLTSGHKVRGIGFYTKNLINALGKKVEAVDFKEVDLTRYDVVHYPYFNPFHRTLPFRKQGKTVVTIHDVIPLIYPKHYPPGLKGGVRFLLQKYLLKQVDAVIADTEASKKDIVRFLGVSPSKIFPIHLAPAKHFRKLDAGGWRLEIRKKYNLPDRFVLYVGDLYVGDVNYNKNISGLVRACELARLPLVIVGKQALEVEERGLGLDVLSGPKDWVRFLFNIPHPELAHYKQILASFEKSKSILRLGFIPDKDLVAIYNLATIYCQPSFYEGFGLPVLEAMACGTPIVASETQALVEIAEGAVLFANPHEPKDMAEKMKKIIENKGLQESLINKGKQKLFAFSWKKTAKQTFQVYRQILKE